MNRQIATITSKGQITIPKEVRRQLNLREGDHVEFASEGGRMVIGRAKEEEDPFQAYLGAIPAFRNKREIATWLRSLRDDSARR